MSAAARPASQVMLTEEQRDILREATAYRFLHYRIGCGGRGGFALDISASAINENRMIWNPHRLGTGTIAEMAQLRKAAMAEYDRLTQGSK